MSEDMELLESVHCSLGGQHGKPQKAFKKEIAMEIAPWGNQHGTVQKVFSAEVARGTVPVVWFHVDPLECRSVYRARMTG